MITRELTSESLEVLSLSAGARGALAELAKKAYETGEKSDSCRVRCLYDYILVLEAKINTMESGGSQENTTDLDTLKAAVDSLWSSGAGDAEDAERREILLEYISATHPDSPMKDETK